MKAVNRVIGCQDKPRGETKLSYFNKKSRLIRRIHFFKHNRHALGANVSKISCDHVHWKASMISLQISQHFKWIRYILLLDFWWVWSTILKSPTIWDHRRSNSAVIKVSIFLPISYCFPILHQSNKTSSASEDVTRCCKWLADHRCVHDMINDVQNSLRNIKRHRAPDRHDDNLWFRKSHE